MNHHRAPLHCQFLHKKIINGRYIYAELRIGSKYTNQFTGYDLVNRKVFSFDLKTVKVAD